MFFFCEPKESFSLRVPQGNAFYIKRQNQKIFFFLPICDSKRKLKHHLISEGENLGLTVKLQDLIKSL